MARLVWKVLLDVVFLELVRHLEFHLLYNMKPASVCVTLPHQCSHSYKYLSLDGLSPNTQLFWALFSIF